MNNIFSNYKEILSNLDNNFYFKLLLLFIGYLVTTHLFSDIHTEYFKPVLDKENYVYIRIPNTICFKILWTIVFVLLSSYIYNIIIKPFLI
jgi:hypothetical protein